MALPETVDNGVGEQLTFVRIEEDHPEGPTLWLEGVVQPGKGPPMHVHYQQEEALIVKRGRLGYQRGAEEVRYAGPGETVVFPKGTPHKFWAEGDEVLHCEGYCRPPHNVQYFLGEVYRSTERNGNGRPGDLDSALLLNRYRHEYDMLEIPAFVRRVVFPLLRAGARLRGKDRKFEDGPPPLSPA